MFTLRRALIASGSLVLVALVAGIVWFFYGPGLGEETGYRLAVEEAQRYARDNKVDLSSYSAPQVGKQTGSRLYTFTWASKQEPNSRLTVVVDSQLVNVKIIETPNMRSN